MSSFGPHFAAGATIGFIGVGFSALTTTSPTFSMMAAPLVTGVMGALTPDMDIKSKSSKIMYLIFLSIAGYFIYNGKIELALLTLFYSIIPQLFSHRGFIHSLIFDLISTALLYYTLIYLLSLDLTTTVICCSTYFFGFISHKIMDAL